MDSVGTLKILIEADTAGLTSQLKRATNNIVNFVGSMNKQEINWTSILSRTISPAIISGIASTFALALSQSMTFANAMTQTANISTEAFGENSSAAKAAALDIQASTGASASSVAESIGIATRSLKDYAAGQALVAEAAKYSLVTGIPLLELVNELTPVMEQWGITDATEIKNTIEDLFGVAAQGKVSISSLLSAMSDTGPMLKGKTSILEASSALEAFSNQAGMTAPSAISIFKKIASAAFGDIKDQAQLSAMGVGNIKKAVEDGGMTKAIANLESSFNRLGNTSKVILAQNAGFDDKTVANLVSASKSYSTIAKDSKIISENASTLGKNIENNLSASNKLQVAWGALKTQLIGIMEKSGVFDTITEAMTYLADLLKNPKQTISETAAGFNWTDLIKGSMGMFDVFGMSKLFGANSASAATSTSQTNTYNYNNYISSNYMGSGKTTLSPNLDYSSYYGYNKK